MSSVSLNQNNGLPHAERISSKQRVVEEFERSIGSLLDKETPVLEGATDYIRQEGYDVFIRRLEDIAKANPSCLRVHAELAWIYTWHKKYDLAIEELSKINAITPVYEGKQIREIIEYLYRRDSASAIRELSKSSAKNIDFNLINNFAVTLDYLFPNSKDEIKELIKNLPAIHNLYNWRYPAMEEAEGMLLYLITRLSKPQVIVEAGTFMGTSTLYLAKGCCDNKIGRVITVDKREDSGYAVPDTLLDYVEFQRNIDIRDALPAICKKEGKIDIFFHDSDNYYELILWEVRAILAHINENSLIIAHDVLNLDDAPDMDVARFFAEIKNQVGCYFFDTGNGIGVIKNSHRLKLTGL